MENKITIDESEYREYIRLKVTNDELEKITQKRIADAVITAVDAKNKEWQDKYDKTIEDFETEGAVRVVKDVDGFVLGIKTTMLISSKNKDLSELIAKYGLESVVEYDEYRIIGAGKHYFEYKGTKFYASDGLKTLEKDIESAAKKLNKIRDKMVAIRGIDPEIFDAMTYHSDTEKLNVKKEVKERSQSWWSRLLKD